MRLTFWVLLGLASLCFVLAGLSASRGSQTDARAVTASGIVRELVDGPHHVLVEVKPPNGPSFVFPANTQVGLQPGQKVAVRYLPDEPRETARAVSDDASSGAWPFLIVGLMFLGAALLSPTLVRMFPDWLAFRVRP